MTEPVAGPCVDDLNCEIGIECGEGGVCGGPGAGEQARKLMGYVQINRDGVACADPSDCAPSYGCSLTDSECGGVDAGTCLEKITSQSVL